MKPQVRKTFDINKISLLAEDIDAKGLIHPVTLMKHPTQHNKYILLIGGNRLEAYKQLQRKTIPAIIKSYSENEGDIQLLQLLYSVLEVPTCLHLRFRYEFCDFFLCILIFSAFLQRSKSGPICLVECNQEKSKTIDINTNIPRIVVLLPSNTSISACT